MFVIMLDKDKDVLYYVSEDNEKLVERLCLVFDFLETKRLVFWYSQYIEDDDAETQIEVKTMEEFLTIIPRLICEERKAMKVIKLNDKKCNGNAK